MELPACRSVPTAKLKKPVYDIDLMAFIAVTKWRHVKPSSVQRTNGSLFRALSGFASTNRAIVRERAAFNVHSVLPLGACHCAVNVGLFGSVMRMRQHQYEGH